VDSHSFFIRGYDFAVFDYAAGAIYGNRIALVAYWLNILLLGATLYFSWVSAVGSRLVKPDLPAPISTAIKKRILVAQALYAFGALLCTVNTCVRIGFIVLVQLNYAIAPRLPGRAQRSTD
jgi:hypothetical protein